MRESLIYGAVLLVAWWAVFLAPVVICLQGDKIEELKKEAVERGAATWVVDAKTGDTQFTWKEIYNESK